MTLWKKRLLAGLLSLPALWLGGPAAQAQVSVQVDVQFGSYPRLVRVPGYPVYYSPGAPANLFFYDGLYWLYVDDRWYTSSWYDGPWSWVDPFDVPLFVLRVPVRYYPVPPPFFRPWRTEGPPRWDEHWGPDWRQRHPDWDRWDRRRAPPPAPLPVYQRPYGGGHYPTPDEQRALQQRQYHYQPRDPVARAHLQPPATVPHDVSRSREASPRAEPPGRSDRAEARSPGPLPERGSRQPPIGRPQDEAVPRARVDVPRSQPQPPSTAERQRDERADRGRREPHPMPTPPAAAPVQRPATPHAPEPPRMAVPPQPTHERGGEAGGPGPGRGHEAPHREERGRDR